MEIVNPKMKTIARLVQRKNRRPSGHRVISVMGQSIGVGLQTNARQTL
jgi:hypothetical protein